MVELSAFADEISDDLSVQIETLKANGVANIELRGVWGKNVLELTTEEVRRIKHAADDNGIGFSAIGSPLGKFPLDGDFQQQLDGLAKAIEFAGILGAPYVRIFSFYIPHGDEPSGHRSQVLDWLERLAGVAAESSIVLAHENEREIYGDTGDRCLDLLTSIRSPALTGIFDFANFVLCGEAPYEDCWVKLRDHITYFHVKDARMSDGEIVPPGLGDGDVERILAEAMEGGFDGFLTLEPHLNQAEANYGKTSPELFGTATRALKSVLQRCKAK
jgi:sugar phosphate isomerase/epimerase